MAQYRCINCRATKESNQPCSCPVCGYRMFAEPCDRRDTLLSEINRFLSCLKTADVSRDNLVFEGKDKDDKAFPDFDRIMKFVCGKKHTEDFYQSLLYTLNQIKQHIDSRRAQTYPVSFQRLNETLKPREEVLLRALQTLCPDGSFTLDEPAWEETALLYFEAPNEALLPPAHTLLEMNEKLARKIIRFIKANNLYGDSHQYRPKKLKHLPENEDDWKSAAAQTAQILEKTYTVDIDENGFEQLKEMLTCLWHNIQRVTAAPLRVPNYRYRTAGGEFDEGPFLARLRGMLQERYDRLARQADIETFLASKNEEELFSAYRDMMHLDTFGILNPESTELVDIGESEKKLDAMIGLEDIKENVRKIKAYMLANKDSGNLNIHMCFLGNPGSGKTEVARIIAGILYENKILPTNNIVEVDRSGLVSEYFGATADKTEKVIQSAMGGVLFIDEAYALGNNSDHGITDYGKEAIDTLVKAMEDYRGKFCVILAGYRNETLKMLSLNPGFQSRIPFILDFPNYSREELRRIAQQMLDKRQYTAGAAAMDRILDITDVRRKDQNFANAREVRNILDHVILCQSLRAGATGDREIGIADVNKYIADAKIPLPTAGEGLVKKILTAEEELDALIGLGPIKKTVKKIKAYAKKNKNADDFSLHMCFVGNPGTGKTEVARILSRILYDAGVLSEAKVVETDGQGLIGKYIGQTGPKTKAKIDEAMNGVLFIDEAYTLLPADNGSDYGDEAIAVLLKEMEDKRGQFCVILAGYKKEMKQLLGANPGLQSRIPFTLDFPDYTREELREIAERFLQKKHYEIEDSALSLLLDITDYARNRPNFANARTVRNILDQVIMNQNLRTEDTAGDNLITAEDVREYMADEKIDLAKMSGENHLGFY